MVCRLCHLHSTRNRVTWKEIDWLPLLAPCAGSLVSFAALLSAGAEHLRCSAAEERTVKVRDLWRSVRDFQLPPSCTCDIRLAIGQSVGTIEGTYVFGKG